LIGTDDGICTDQGVCTGLCQGVDCNDGNDCTVDLCDPPTGDCSWNPVANGTSCGGGEGKCTDIRDTEPKEDGIWCQFEANETLGIDCELLGNSAPLPLIAQVRTGGIAFAGVPVDVVIEDRMTILPAPLVCSFIAAGFASAQVANSFVGNAISNANIPSATLNSFLVDGSAGNARVSPHESIQFDFGFACGDNCLNDVCTSDGTTACTVPTFENDCPGAGTGPGIVAPTFVRDGAAQTIPPGPTPFPITPTAAGTVDFTIDYSGTALELEDLLGQLTIPVACLGGGCAIDSCAPIDRDGIASPRIMYDAICNKAQAAAGNCTPFEDFSNTADVCKEKPGGIEPADLPDNVPPCCDNSLPCVAPCANLPSDLFCVTQPNVDSCCAAIGTDYPTATAAQQPQLPVSAAP
jgi:hypothetical protein